jgi:hypothetical protein
MKEGSVETPPEPNFTANEKTENKVTTLIQKKGAA